MRTVPGIYCTRAEGQIKIRETNIQTNSTHAHVQVVDSSICEIIFGRVESVLPEEVADVAPGANALGLNARFRCYKYQGGDYFKPHTDGSWPGSLAVADASGQRQLVKDAFGDRWNQFTFLLLLSDEYEGGRTLFHVDGEVMGVRTPRGGALVFPHGGHVACAPAACRRAGGERHEVYG